MNYKNPFNNRIQNNNKNIDNEYDFNLYDPYKNKNVTLPLKKLTLKDIHI